MSLHDDSTIKADLRIASTTTVAVLPPRIFLLLENPKRTNNLGPILRCAAAFAVTQVILVGFEKCNTEGAHGASKHVDIVAFPSWDESVAYARTSILDGGCGIQQIVGLLCCHGEHAVGGYSPEGYSIEHDLDHNTIRVGKCSDGSTMSDAQLNSLPHSYPVHTKPFSREGNIGIILSKSKVGLPTRLASYCDVFVHVPHVPLPPPADHAMGLPLDVPSCLSITLHHFTQWAGYREHVFQGHKFQVASMQRGRLPAFQVSKKNRQARKLDNELASENAIELEGVLGGIFDCERNDYDC